MVPRAGLEPACPYGRWILSPLRLPFRHLGIGEDQAALAAEDEIVPEPLVTGQAGGLERHPSPKCPGELDRLTRERPESAPDRLAEYGELRSRQLEVRGYLSPRSEQ